MNLRARVLKGTGATKHFEGEITSSGIASTREFPLASWIEIEPRDGSYYLLYFDDSGECFTDTWHASLADAKEQAKFEFEVQDEDWREYPSS